MEMDARIKKYSTNQTTTKQEKQPRQAKKKKKQQIHTSQANTKRYLKKWTIKKRKTI